MHTAEIYASYCGLKIGSPHITEAFYPLDIADYITIDISKTNDYRQYNHWQDIIYFLKPVLDTKGIHIMQMGSPKDPKLDGAMRTNGLASLPQIAYLIRNSLLHLSGDVFSALVASHCDKKMITILPGKDYQDFKPIWGSEKNKIFFNLSGKGKSVNNIDISVKPEEIAKGVCGLLDLSLKTPAKSIFFGKKYFDGIEFLECVPNQIVDPSKFGVDNLMYRMDLEFNEKNLVAQLSLSRASVVTNKRINLDVLKAFKNNISQLVYIIDKDDDPKFPLDAKDAGIQNLLLYSYLEKEELTPKKINYMDLGLIVTEKKQDHKNSKVFKDKDPKRLFYRSNRYLLSNDHTYSSDSAFVYNKPIASKTSFSPIINSKKFWSNLDNFYIVEVNSS